MILFVSSPPVTAHTLTLSAKAKAVWITFYNDTEAELKTGGELPQTTVKPLTYGIGDSERLFVNHLMTCTRCKPASRTYCADGLELKANA